MDLFLAGRVPDLRGQHFAAAVSLGDPSEKQQGLALCQFGCGVFVVENEDFALPGIVRNSRREAHNTAVRTEAAHR